MVEKVKKVSALTSLIGNALADEALYFAELDSDEELDDEDEPPVARGESPLPEKK